MTHDPHVSKLVDHLFRRQSAQMVSTLTRVFGVQHLQLAEDVVQETLLKALSVWSFSGVPEKPEGWLMTSARNLALDKLRRGQTFAERTESIAEHVNASLSPDTPDDTAFRYELTDDLLGMMFVCCHPALNRDSQVALTLRTLGGLSTAEIARAFLSSEPTIAQRLVRAKRKLRETADELGQVVVEMPSGSDVEARLDSVLEVLYLLFNEGYSTHAGENLIRHELCEEALRLTGLLVDHPTCSLPRVHALVALICLQMARLPSRVDADGGLLTLEEQDRSVWNDQLIQLGLSHLSHATAGNEVSEYHLQAAIAAVHTSANDFASTDWHRIVELYDHLIELNPSAVFRLNRAVALSQTCGYGDALQALQDIGRDPVMQRYYLYHATLADCYLHLDQPDAAEDSYRQALDLTASEVERRFLERKLSVVRE